MTYALGIDFGTSSTAAAAFDLAGDAALRTRVVTLGNRAAAVPSAARIASRNARLFPVTSYVI